MQSDLQVRIDGLLAQADTELDALRQIAARDFHAGRLITADDLNAICGAIAIGFEMQRKAIACLADAVDALNGQGEG